MTMNDDDPAAGRKASPLPRAKDPPLPADDSSRWRRRLALLVLLGVAGLIGYRVITPGADEAHSPPPAASFPGALQSARVEGRTAHYHLTFADFSRWHLKTDMPALVAAKVDRWLTYGFDDVQATVLVIPYHDLDLERGVELMLQRSRKQFSSFTELERTPLTDRPDRGLLLRIQASRDGRMVEMFMGFFADEAAIYEVTLLTSPEKFSRMGHDLEAVIRSFELPPSEPAKPSSL
jgi:hypothetical protein